MMLTLPDEAHVHIIVAASTSGAPAPLLLSPPPPPASTAPRRSHLLLTSVGVVVLVVIAYVAGERSAPRSAPLQEARAQLRIPEPALPLPPQPGLPALRQQLQAPPTVTPAPGTSAPGENAFGLEN